VRFIEIKSVKQANIAPSGFKIRSVGAGVAQHVEHVGKPTITCTRFNKSRIFT
jgi:hypothetical protein